MFASFYPDAYAESVFLIDYDKIFDAGYRGILFDIDNTLVPHGADSNSEVDDLFRRIHEIGLKTLLLSNNSEERIQRFNQNIGTLYISDADKPNPDGFLNAIHTIGIPKDKLLVIGDQIFSDILGANKIGLHSILVEFIGAKTEKKLGKKRRLEKWILACYKRNKRYNDRLSDFLIREGSSHAF